MVGAGATPGFDEGVNMGWQELLIILVIAVLLFGGTKLAGIGKASGQALREFKEETRGLTDAERAKKVGDQAQRDSDAKIVDAEIIDDTKTT